MDASFETMRRRDARGAERAERVDVREVLRRDRVRVVEVARRLLEERGVLVDRDEDGKLDAAAERAADVGLSGNRPLGGPASKFEPPGGPASKCSGTRPAAHKKKLYLQGAAWRSVPARASASAVDASSRRGPLSASSNKPPIVSEPPQRASAASFLKGTAPNLSACASLRASKTSRHRAGSSNFPGKCFDGTT